MENDSARPDSGSAEQEARDLWAEARRKVEAGDCDFTGRRFPEDPDGVGFKGITFKGKARFHGATFEGDAWFEKATFEGVAWFERATFKGEARFNRAAFKTHARFPEATFKGDAGFVEATFEGDSWLSEATFEEAMFEEDPWFSEATFKRDAGFIRATFKKDAHFGRTTFEGVAWFSGATFKGLARFGEATFEGDARFEEATIEGFAWFGGAAFERVASFEGATFEGDAGFGGATFKGLAAFAGATFNGHAGFEGAEAKELDLLYPWQRPRPFRRAEAGESAYRLAKQSAQRRGDYRRAGHYHYAEQCAINARHRERACWRPWRLDFWKGRESPIWAWGEFLIGRWLFGYGERPLRVLAVGVGVILLWAAIYCFGGVATGVTPEGNQIVARYELLSSLYFSIVTFTTLGYGDLRPPEDLRLVAASEALIGAGLMALFIVCLARKFTR